MREPGLERKMGPLKGLIFKLLIVLVPFSLYSVLYFTTLFWFLLLKLPLFSLFHFCVVVSEGSVFDSLLCLFFLCQESQTKMQREAKKEALSDTGGMAAVLCLKEVASQFQAVAVIKCGSRVSHRYQIFWQSWKTALQVKSLDF